MLILTRRIGESILIDGGIRIVVLGTDGGGVRLGIEAPSAVGIVREEVVQRIAEENGRLHGNKAARDWPPAQDGPDPTRSGREGRGSGQDDGLGR
jgi:carbon storage regulator